MQDINRVILVGHLGADPEFKETKTGKSRCQFSIATHRSYLTAEGKWEEKTDWHSVVAWDKQAELCRSNLFKGSPVFVDGLIQTRSWKNENGVRVKIIEIKAESIRYLGASVGSDASPAIARSGTESA